MMTEDEAIRELQALHFLLTRSEDNPWLAARLGAVLEALEHAQAAREDVTTVWQSPGSGRLHLNQHCSGGGGRLQRTTLTRNALQAIYDQYWGREPLSRKICPCLQRSNWAREIADAHYAARWTAAHGEATS